MDLGSASTKLIDDPAGGLQALATKGAVEFPSLFASREETGERLRALAEYCGSRSLDSDTSIVLFGSWARQELTEGSDDDWAILYGGSLDDHHTSVIEALEVARAKLGGDARKPGSQDVFGVEFSSREVVENIGLDSDSNKNLTRRMLLLLESVEVCGGARDACVQALLTRYLNKGVKDYRIPRFLLNDLVRYWRTICVDFEGKHKQHGDHDPKWVLRNAKLRTSRKLLFAGGLLPVLLCAQFPSEDMGGFLTNWFNAPATDRIAAAFIEFGAIDEGIRALLAYERWMNIQRSQDARCELSGLRGDTRHQSPLFDEIKAIGREFERGLLALLFQTDLAQFAIPYSVF